jgi:hypothetical protein
LFYIVCSWTMGHGVFFFIHLTNIIICNTNPNLEVSLSRMRMVICLQIPTPF